MDLITQNNWKILIHNDQRNKTIYYLPNSKSLFIPVYAKETKKIINKFKLSQIKFDYKNKNKK